MTPEYDTSLSARSLARIAFITFVAFAIAISLLGATSVFAQENFTSQANLNGSQEVPSRSTNAYGNFSLTSPDNASATYTLNVYNATSSVTGAHIHCGAPGQNGPVVVPLNSSGTITDSSIQDQTNCPTPIHDVDDLKQAIRNGHAYVNVHTTTYPDGEIRGNLTGSGGSPNNPPQNPDCMHNSYGSNQCDGNGHDDWNNDHGSGWKDDDHDGKHDDWWKWKDDDHNGKHDWNNDWKDDNHDNICDDWNDNWRDNDRNGKHDRDDKEWNNDWDKKDDYTKDWNNDWDKDDHDWKKDEYSDSGKKNDWDNENRWDRDWDRGDHDDWNDGKNDDHDYDRGSGVSSYLRVGNGVTGYVSIGN